jgi:tetratricopeptide (TPR) repeat protein
VKTWLRRIGLVILLLAPGLLHLAYRAATQPVPPVVQDGEFEPRVIAEIRQAEAAVRNAPRSAEPWARLGGLLAAHGDAERGKACFAQAARHDDANPLWPYLEGYLVQSLESPAAARAQYEEAARRAENPMEVIELRILESLLDAGLVQEAERRCEFLASRFTGNPFVAFYQGRCEAERGDWPRAVDHLSRSQQQLPGYRPTATLLASVYQQLGDANQAQEQQQRAASASLQHWPDPLLQSLHQFTIGEVALRTMAESLLAAGNLAGAEQTLRRAQQLHPESPDVPLELAANLVAQQRFDQAIPLLRDYRKAHADRVEAAFYLAAALEATGQLAESLQCLDEVVARYPAMPQARIHQARVQMKTNQPNAAEQSLRQAIATAPSSFEAHRNLAVLLAQQGRRDEALQTLTIAERLAAQNSSQQTALRNLRRLIERRLDSPGDPTEVLPIEPDAPASTSDTP